MKIEFDVDDIWCMEQAIELWGIDAQIHQTVEEAGEFLAALSKHYWRDKREGTRTDLIDEMFDLELMLAQLRMMLGVTEKEFNERKALKMEKFKMQMKHQEKMKRMQEEARNDETNF